MTLSATSYAQRDKNAKPYKEVNIEDLKESPQNFWASGILFYDALTEIPAEKGVKINKKHYYPFTTETLGNCYAAEDLAEELRFGRLDTEYVFSGTVLNYRRDYIVVLHQATQVLEEQAQEEQSIDSLISLFDESRENNLQQFSEFLKRALTSISGYAQSKELEVDQVLSPESEELKKIRGIIRKSLSTVEQENGNTANEILVAYTLHLMVNKYGASMPPMAAPEALTPEGDVTSSDAGSVLDPSQVSYGTAPVSLNSGQPVDDVFELNPTRPQVTAVEPPVSVPVVTPPPVFETQRTQPTIYETQRTQPKTYETTAFQQPVVQEKVEEKKSGFRLPSLFNRKKQPVIVEEPVVVKKDPVVIEKDPIVFEPPVVARTGNDVQRAKPTIISEPVSPKVYHTTTSSDSDFSDNDNKLDKYDLELLRRLKDKGLSQ
ncbi:MAG: hypothetical protein AAF492_12390 [Verrucomicrobiota bacterium]